jgi:hypothetical protein
MGSFRHRGEDAMKFHSSLALSAVALFLAVAPSLASPCEKEMADIEAAFDAKLSAAAAAGPTAPESTLATLHHQPTLSTVAQAEAQLGDISPENARIVTDALDRAHAADERDDVQACRHDLAEARAAFRK